MGIAGACVCGGVVCVDRVTDASRRTDTVSCDRASRDIAGLTKVPTHTPAFLVVTTRSMTRTRIRTRFRVQSRTICFEESRFATANLGIVLLRAYSMTTAEIQRSTSQRWDGNFIAFASSPARLTVTVRTISMEEAFPMAARTRVEGYLTGIPSKPKVTKAQGIFLAFSMSTAGRGADGTNKGAIGTTVS